MPSQSQTDLDISRGIDEHSKWEHVEELFKRFGHVEACYLPPPEVRHVEPSYIRFKHVQDAEKALSAAKKGEVHLQGKSLYLQWHRPTVPAGANGGSSSSSSRPNDPPHSVYSRSGGRQEKQDRSLEDFIRKHNLDSNVEDELRKSPQQHVQEVLRKVEVVSQKEEINSINGFIISILKSAGKGSNGRNTQSGSSWRHSKSDDRRGDRNWGRQQSSGKGHRSRSRGAEAHRRSGDSQRLYGKLAEELEPVSGKAPYRFIKCKELPKNLPVGDVYILPSSMDAVRNQPEGTDVSFVLRQRHENGKPQAEFVEVIKQGWKTRRVVRQSSRGDRGISLRKAPGRGGGRLRNTGLDDSRLGEFISVNQLDEDCQEALKDVCREMQTQVIDFEPGKLEIESKNPSAAVMGRLKEVRAKLSEENITPAQPSAEDRGSGNYADRRHGSDDEDRSRSRSMSRQSEASSQFSAVGRDTHSAPLQPGIKIVENNGDAERKGSEKRTGPSRSRSYSASGSSRSRSRPSSPVQRQVQAEQEAQEDLTMISCLLEISNIPDLSGTGVTPDKYLSDLFNAELTILPDFDQGAGDQPIMKSWLQGKSVAVLETQNKALAASTQRTLHELDLFGNSLKVRTLTQQEAETAKQSMQ